MVHMTAPMIVSSTRQARAERMTGASSRAP